MRVKFARTVRHHLQDASAYQNPGSHVWTKDDCVLADVLLNFLKRDPRTDETNLVMLAAADGHVTDESAATRVWERMRSYPYMFEVAALRNDLSSLSLDGTRSRTAQQKDPERELSLANTLTSRWRVPLNDFSRFAEEDRLSPALFELFAISFRKHAPSNVHLGKWHQTRKLAFAVSLPSTLSTHYFGFPLFFRARVMSRSSCSRSNSRQGIQPCGTCTCCNVTTHMMPIRWRP